MTDALNTILGAYMLVSDLTSAHTAGILARHRVSRSTQQADQGFNFRRYLPELA